MKRFRFNLDALLRIYAREEETRKRELGEANRALFISEQELVRLGREYDAYQEKEAKVREKGETVFQMRLYIQYVFDLKHRIEGQRDQVKQCMARVKQCRERLVEARRRVKAIERIRERRFEAWKKERRIFEVKLIDDLVTQKFIREHPAAG